MEVKILLLLLSFITFYKTATCTECKEVGETCNEDCDCCGSNEKPAIKCEQRNNMKGRRCFRSGSMHAKCMHDSECRSQKCGKRGFCIPHFSHDVEKPNMCEMDIKTTFPVKGTIQENSCACPKPEEPSIYDALKASDDDPKTIYVNNYAIDGGLEIEPLNEEGSLRFLQVCNNDDAPESDPLCYKVEGYCSKTESYEFVDEGDLPMPLERNKCVEVAIKNKSQYKKYRITFPCQRGPCRDACSNRCSAKPIMNLQPTRCPDYIDDGKNEIANFELDNYHYNDKKDVTHFYYHLNTTNKHNGLEYLMMQWEGDCRIEYYNVYEDLNFNAIMEKEEECCFKNCAVDYYYDSPDWHLCMSGLEIYSWHLYKNSYFFVHLVISGKIDETTERQYGAYVDEHVEYGYVQSPKCGIPACPSTCPLKVKTVKLFTNCNEKVEESGEFIEEQMPIRRRR